MKIPVCVIDKRAFWRDCLTLCLTSSSANLAAIGYDTIEDWLEASSHAPPAIILLCATSEEGTARAIQSGLDRILASVPDARVVIVSDVDNPVTMVSALERGARGFLTMSLSLEVVIEAIRIVNVGGTFVPASGLLSARQGFTAPVDHQAAALEGRPHFTERQLAIIACVRRGEPNKIIAHKLNMTESTVKVHIRNIMRKIKAKNRTEVAFLTNELQLPGETQND
ncbi:LuxR C-terminal-related transcriptional regulator [Labrys neptuniae]